MNKFKTKTGIRETKISTASLPDIVFLLLFFFMVSATMKEKEDLIETEIPEAKHITKAEKKILIKRLFVGVPKNPMLGHTPLVSDGEKFISQQNLVQWVNEKRNETPESLRDRMIILIKADEEVQMGLIADIQEQLRLANARKVIYRTMEEAL